MAPFSSIGMVSLMKVYIRAPPLRNFVLGAFECETPFPPAFEFDYIVVGAGSAGSVVAARLADELPSASVALIDAGQEVKRLIHSERVSHRHREFRGYFLSRPCFTASSQKCMYNWQGKALGGGSAVNGMYYTRLPSTDMPHWDPREIESAYEALETSIPRVLVSPRWEALDQVLRTVVFSFQKVVPGLRWRLDPHSHGSPTARISGVWRSQSPWWMSGDRERITHVDSMARARSVLSKGSSMRNTPYVRLIRRSGKGRLQVFPNTTVVRVLTDNAQACGVEDNFGNVFRARQEVVVSAGALATPNLLYSSGLATNLTQEKAAGRRFFIKPTPDFRQELPRRLRPGSFPLQDHRIVFLHNQFAGLACGESAMECFRRENASSGQEIHVYLNASYGITSSPEAGVEFEIQITSHESRSDCGINFQDPTAVTCIVIAVILLQASGDGRYEVDESESTKGVSYIHLSMIDVEKFRSAFTIIKKMLDASELIPARLDTLLTSDGYEFVREVRGRVSDFQHPIGTCPVGLVVDSQLRVLDASHLRVADNSVLRSASGHPDAGAQVIGYMAASFIIAAHRSNLIAASKRTVSFVPNIRLESKHKHDVLLPMVGLGTGTWREPHSASHTWMQDATLAFLRMGGRHIDTAIDYGNHREIGEAIRTFLKDIGGNQRQTLFVTSKIPPAEMDFQEASIAIDRILSELGLDYLDMLLIHWPRGKPHLSCAPQGTAPWKNCRMTTWRAFEQAKKAGKVRAIGVANYEQAHLEELLSEAEIPPAVNQFEMHPWWYNKELLDFCASRNIAVVAYSSLGPRALPWLAPDMKDPLLHQIAEGHKRSVAQILLRWGVQHGAAVIPCTAQPEHMLDNFAIFEFELTTEEMIVLDSIGLNTKVHEDPRYMS